MFMTPPATRFRLTIGHASLCAVAAHRQTNRFVTARTARLDFRLLKQSIPKALNLNLKRSRGCFFGFVERPFPTRARAYEVDDETGENENGGVAYLFQEILA